MAPQTKERPLTAQEAMVAGQRESLARGDDAEPFAPGEVKYGPDAVLGFETDAAGDPAGHNVVGSPYLKGMMERGTAVGGPLEQAGLHGVAKAGITVVDHGTDARPPLAEPGEEEARAAIEQIAQAQAEAERVIAERVTEAQAEADRVLTEAREEAQRVVAEAQAEADRLVTEAREAAAAAAEQEPPPAAEAASGAGGEAAPADAAKGKQKQS